MLTNNMIQIGTDFQGWPVNAMTLREILKQLGFKENEDSLSINKDNKLLDAYPYLLEDDGMGYGVDSQYVIEIDKKKKKKNVKVIDYEMTNNHPDFPKLNVEKVIKDDKITVFNVFRQSNENKTQEEIEGGQ